MSSCRYILLGIIIWCVLYQTAAKSSESQSEPLPVCDARAFERVHSACVQRDESTVSVYAKNESLWTVVVAQNIHRDLRSYRCGVLRTDFQVH